MPPVRTPVGKIAAPMFPDGTGWLNVATLRMDQQLGRPVLVEFFDFCRVSSLRTLPYSRPGRRSTPRRLRVISVHAPGFPPRTTRRGRERPSRGLASSTRVLLDTAAALWRLYGNQGWPARYLLDKQLRLFEIHFGEGAYRETEEAIQELLGVEARPVDPTCIPRTTRRAARRADARPARAPTRGPTRPARCGPCSRATGTIRSTATIRR